MKTGLFFGSFNPVHIGHMAIANYMLEFTEIQELWFVVSPQNPFKAKKTLLNQYDRLEMVNLAISGFPRMMASDIEFRLPQPSYTINTLTYLSEKFPTREFLLIMGTDGLNKFHRWKNADVIMKNYKRVIYPRHGTKAYPENNMQNAVLVDAPMIEISSSFIREAIKNRKNVHFFLPPKVYQYIDEMGFYA